MNLTLSGILGGWGIWLLALHVGAVERLSLFEFEEVSVWAPSPDTPSVEVASCGERRAFRFRCNLSVQKERCYWDVSVSLNLLCFGRLTLEIYTENASGIRSGSLYFRSGEGWYGASFPVLGGMQSIRLMRGDFRPEGSPRGWDVIEGVRLAFWKGSDQDAVVDLFSATAFRDDIFIVRDRKNPEPYATQMARLLERTGLDFGVLDGSEVALGALEEARLVFFPYNPNLTDEEVAEIVAFVRRGGKVMFFYDLPERVAPLIGIAGTQWTRFRYDGEFTTIRFRGDVAGLPPSVVQGSWNVRIPTVRDAQVLGEWIDSKGTPTGIPAITLHANGVFMGHVLLMNDLDNKCRMLLALVGHLLPERRRELGAFFVQWSSRVSGFKDFEEVSAFIRDMAHRIPEGRRNVVLERLEVVQAFREKIPPFDNNGTYETAISLAFQMGETLRETFFRSLPSRAEEFRGVWCHSAYGVAGWSWEESIKNLAEKGFTAIFPNVLWGGLAYYPSRLLPVAPEVATKGDQIAACLTAAKKYGIQVHVWKVNWNLTIAPPSFVEALRKEGRLQRNREGVEIPWLCPSSPENFRLERDSLLEVVRNYEVDGIHFDYIRYPDPATCFCEGCRKRFEVAVRKRVQKWPDDVLRGKLASRFADWRREQITRLVRAVSEEARKIRPGIRISAAVFHDYPVCRDTVGQDWKAWVEAGYLDFVCPMDYTANAVQFGNWVSSQLARVGGKIPLYPGIGASAPGLLPEETAFQVHVARESGAPGFVIFNYDLEVAEKHLSALRLGATAPPEQ